MQEDFLFAWIGLDHPDSYRDPAGQLFIRGRQEDPVKT